MQTQIHSNKHAKIQNTCCISYVITVFGLKQVRMCTYRRIHLCLWQPISTLCCCLYFPEDNSWESVGAVTHVDTSMQPFTAAHPSIGSFHQVYSSHSHYALAVNSQKHRDTLIQTNVAVSVWQITLSHMQSHTLSSTLIFRAGRIYDWFILNQSLGVLQDWASAQSDRLISMSALYNSTPGCGCMFGS